MNSVNEKIRRELFRVIGGPTQDEMDVDEIMGLMLQISFALLMIFMIAFFLFRVKVGTEVDQVQNVKQVALVSVQRQKLIVALDKADNYWRAYLGLTAFAVVGRDGGVEYRAKDLIVGGGLSGNGPRREAFVEGAKRAETKFANPIQFQREWRDGALVAADVKDPLLPENQAWLKHEIEIRTDALKRDCEGVQSQAAAAILEFFVGKPEAARDTSIDALLRRYEAADDTEKSLIARRLSDLSRKRAFETLEKQCGAKLLLSY